MPRGILDYDYEIKQAKEFEPTLLLRIEIILRRIYYSDKLERKILFRRFLKKITN
jgi:hypothetical protein